MPQRKLAVAWQAGTRQSVSYLETLALGGLFILTRQPLPIRSMVKVLLAAGHVLRGNLRRFLGLAVQIP